jgi:hypothetical protein
MKGSVFGGILYLPQHPAADIHGLVRGAIRTKSWLWAEEILSKAGIERTHALWSLGMWSESKSAVEILITQQHYGELLICPLVEAYLNSEHYVPLKNTSIPPVSTPCQPAKTAK